ncbi:phosphodiester glycosidase family protein [Nakamurella silvestris]|nr:phosphodiester glycosidase family protein [Nakamurella silvestris]
MLPPQEPPGHRPRRRRVRRIVISSVLAVVVVAGGGTYWALDRYVIDHVQVADVRALEASASAAAAATATAEVGNPNSAGTTADGSSTSASTTAKTSTTADATTASAAVLTDNSYVSDDTSIKISKVTTGTGDATVTYFVADVVVSDATEIRSGFADNAFGNNITENTSAIAADNNAIFAINGDYYGFRDTGIVIRDGIIYRSSGARQGLAMYKDGTVKVYDETATTAEQLVADGVWNTLSFGPALVENSEIVSGIDSVEVDTNFGNHSIQGEQPRTAVGLIDANHYVFVVVDGRSTGYSAGVTMTGLAEIMQGLGVTTAYNIDGGGSSTMYFNGAVVNNPLGKGEERGTSDILYIGQ